MLVRVSALGFRADTLLLGPGPDTLTIRLERDNELPTTTVRGEV